MNAQDFFERDLRLSDPEQIRQLLDGSKTESVPKGTLLVEAGEYQTHIPFLLEGIFRGFLIDTEGRDVTDCFAHRYGDVLMGCNGPGAPSCISMEAVTDGEILLIPVQTVTEQLDCQLLLLQKYNHYLMQALKRHWEEKMLLHRCSAMQRYQWFLKAYPGLIDTVSNKHIASFLGMTPVTLSRLRRQLREEARDSK